ncbi:MAG: alanine dehydrogenase [Saprospiraceae bacterium]|nr:alanine dehydrogenase [Saprospiraceae bacterium]
MSKRIPIPSELTSGQHAHQEQALAIRPKGHRLFIGIPRESSTEENRVALVPSNVAALVGHGHRVVIQNNAGKRAHFPDHLYSEAGAEIVHSEEEVYKAEIVIRTAPPTMEELDLMHPNQVLISPLHLPAVRREYLEKLRTKRVIALAMEYIQDESGAFPVVRIMSEIAGISAILTAAELLSKANKGTGLLLGGISGVPPARVVILGSGVVAEFAARAALGLGVEVRVFDNNIYKLMRLKHHLGHQIFTSAFDPYILEREMREADVAIGAIHSKSGRTPVVVSEEVVSKMKDGAVIIDISIDQGGCFATSELTTHSKPTFVKHGVIHYGVPNIPSRVAKTASSSVSNILTPILLRLETLSGIESLLYQSTGLRNGVYAYKGCITNTYLGEKFDMKVTDLDLLMTSVL